jgi:hypothetical protein
MPLDAANEADFGFKSLERFFVGSPVSGIETSKERVTLRVSHLG